MSTELMDVKTASLLQENRRKDIEATHFSRNHVPMTLAALALFGRRYRGLTEVAEGDGESLLDTVRSHYAEAVIPELDRRPQPSFGKPQDYSVVITRENWKDHLGRLECFSSFCKFFQAEVQDEKSTVDGLLKMYFTSELQRGIHAAAYHALLRISFGVLLNDSLEVAFGLGYLCAGYSDIVQFTPMNSSFASSNDPTDEDLLYEINSSIEAVLDAESIKSVSLEGVGSITQRQQFMASLPQFAKLIPNLLRNQTPDNNSPGGELWEGILINISKLYSEFHDFTILHGLTSCYALKVVWPWLTREGIQAYWTSVLASFACLLSQLQKGKKWPAPTIVAQVPDTLAHAPSSTDEEACLNSRWADAVRFAFQTLVDGRGKYSSSEIEHVLKLIFTVDCIRLELPSLDQQMFDLAIREIRYPAPYL